MSYLRTPKHRRLQAERIRAWKPWERSTGPRTAEGKARAARNAWKGGNRALLRELARVLSDIRLRWREPSLLSPYPEPAALPPLPERHI